MCKIGGDRVRVFGRPEGLAERLEASGYDIEHDDRKAVNPASEIEAGMELHLPWRPGCARGDPVAPRALHVRAILPACGRQACLVKVGQGSNGYKNIEEPVCPACRQAGDRQVLARHGGQARGWRMTGCHMHVAESERRKPL